jgi:hypothetical protein
MKAVVARVTRTHPVVLEEVNIDGDPELERRYGLEIPVLLIDGRKAAKFRVTEAGLLRLLRDRAG